MVGVGLIGFFSKLQKWDESAMFFDGSSLGAFSRIPNFCKAVSKILVNAAVYVFGIVVYLTVTISCLRTIVNPVKDVDTREDQVAAMSVLSAGNVIIIIALVLILALQVRPFLSILCPAQELKPFTQPFVGWPRVGTPHGGESYCGLGRVATKKGNFNNSHREEGPVMIVDFIGWMAPWPPRSSRQSAW
jgi:hypothetical protein